MADLAHSWLALSAPVAAAQVAGRPLVALESTIIAHGMPYPQNVQTAREAQSLRPLRLSAARSASGCRMMNWNCWAARARRTR